MRIVTRSSYYNIGASGISQYLWFLLNQLLCNKGMGQLVNSTKRYLSKCMGYMLILCSIYSFAGADEVHNEVYIEGVGVLSVGEQINHQKYGIGKIKMLEKTESGYIGIIVFESGEKPMLISKDYFLPNNDK